MVYNILVIDDNKSRVAKYKEIFSNQNFTVEFASSFEDSIEKIESPQYHLIIQDLVLDSWVNSSGLTTSEMFDRIIEKIGLSKPIIVISAEFSDSASWVSRISNKNNVIGYLGWNELERQEAALTRLSLELKKFYNMTLLDKEPGQPVSILFLSDLQFGDPDYASESFLNYQLISNTFEEYKINPDLLVITGDITYSGLPSQFKEAKEWLLNLCKVIFPRDFNFSDRILLVPGNHDVNLTLSCADCYEYDFDEDKRVDYLKKREKYIHDHQPFSFYPFCDFAFSITGDRRWIGMENNLNWINDRFLNWGIRFVQLNTVADMNYTDYKYCGVSQGSIQEMLNYYKSNKYMVNKPFTVFLAHHDPQDLGYTAEGKATKRNEVKDLFMLINSIGADLFISGHSHTSTKLAPRYKYQGRFTDNLQYSIISSLTLDAKARKEDAKRGFSILKLERSNYTVTKCVQTNFEITNQLVNKVYDHEVLFD
ncbi:MAG: metallophosphoesterase [Chitinophagales bacterium]